MQHTTLWPGCTVPRWILPSASRPLQLSWSRLLTSICKRAVGIGARRWDVLDDRVEERFQGHARVRDIGSGRALASIGVQDRRVELPGLLGEFEEQVVRGLDRLGRLRVGAVDLVDDDDRLQAERHRLTQHDARLGHRAFCGVDQEQAAIRHAQDALDLATEVGVAGGVDDVELDPVVSNRRGLGEDGDPLLALEIVGIHDQLADLLVGGEDARLLQQGIHERGLAVVDVRDDRDVAEVCPALFAGDERRWHLSILTALRSSSARDPVQELLNAACQRGFEVLRSASTDLSPSPRCWCSAA